LFDFFSAYAFSFTRFFSLPLERKKRREIIIIFPFSPDNILVDLSTYASFAFSLFLELIHTQHPPTRFFFPFFLRSREKPIWECCGVCMSAHAYLKENPSRERRMTITFDSDGNLLVDLYKCVYIEQRKDRALVETLFFY
jgi:hypothetical protein